MFSKYSGEQVNRIPEGYVQAMGQSPLAQGLAAGIQGYQMVKQMDMANKKMELDERSTKAAEGSAVAAQQKAITDEAKLALATEDTAIKGQADINKTDLENRKFEIDTLTSARDAFSNENGELEIQLKDIRKNELYAKGDKALKKQETDILARKVTIGTRISEFNDRLAESLKPKQPQQYRLPGNISMTPNDPLVKKYKDSTKNYEESLKTYQSVPGAAIVPKTPQEAAEEFRGQLTPDELRRIMRFNNPFGQ